MALPSQLLRWSQLPKMHMCRVSGVRSLCTSPCLVVGGGIVGASTALELAKAGRNVTVLEQNTMTSGSTWHAAGMVGVSKSHEAMVGMVKWSLNFYQGESGSNEADNIIGWRQTGSLGVARTPGTWNQLKRANVQLLNQFNVEHTLYGAGGDAPLDHITNAVHPLLITDDVIGALHTPSDGIVNPSDACMHIVKQCKEYNVQFIENCQVFGFDTHDDSVGDTKVIAVHTTSGRIACSDVLLACGQWTRQLAAKLDINVPTAIVPHQYVVFDHMGTDNVTDQPFVHNGLPVIRDYDNKVYIKPEIGGLLVGAFEDPHRCMPEAINKRNLGIVDVPSTASHELYDSEFMKVEDAVMSAMTTIPRLGDCGIKNILHAPDCHSVDHFPILGRAPRTSNLWVATGFNSQGIQLGPAVGAVMSDWMTYGIPHKRIDADFTALDIRRFHPTYTSDKNWCQMRALEGYSQSYHTTYPTQEFIRPESPDQLRNVRVSAVHDNVSELGAVFGSVAESGFERALYFDETTGRSEKLSFDARETSWWPMVRSEHLAVRNNAGIMDMSSFGKLFVSGDDAAEVLEWCSSSLLSSHTLANMNDPCSVLYTQLLNEQGGIESDVTILPIENHHGIPGFYVVTGSANVIRDADYIRRIALNRNKYNIDVADVTDQYAVIAIMGPESPRVLETIFPGENFDDATFPYGTAQYIECDPCDGLWALRISYSGSVGWELHCPRAAAESIWKKAYDANESLKPIGYHALLTSLRMEKGYLHFGHDITPSDTPLEAGLNFVCRHKLKSNVNFIGKNVLLDQLQHGLHRKLVNFKCNEAGVSLWGGEGIFRNGVRVGHLTSGGVGYTSNQERAIGMGYVHSETKMSLSEFKEYILSGTFEVEVGKDIVKVSTTLM